MGRPKAILIRIRPISAITVQSPFGEEIVFFNGHGFRKSIFHEINLSGNFLVLKPNYTIKYYEKSVLFISDNESLSIPRNYIKKIDKVIRSISN